VQRRLAVTAALALAAVLAPRTAGAIPYGGVARGADATFRLRAANGKQWQLGLEVTYAVAATEQTQYLMVRLAQCDSQQKCSYNRLWQQPLAVTELTPSPDGGTLKVATTILGRAVTATWQSAGSAGGTAVVVPGSAHVEWVETSEATASVSFSGADCPDDHARASERIDVNGTGTPFTAGPKPPAAWPRGFSATLRCA
jgi:hypothetical protein